MKFRKSLIALSLAAAALTGCNQANVQASAPAEVSSQAVLTRMLNADKEPAVVAIELKA